MSIRFVDNGNIVQAEKEYIYYSRGITAHKHMLSLIERGIVPMISVERVKNSRTYKDCDKWLLSNGFRRVLVKPKTNDVFGLSGFIVSQDRYEYYKESEV